MKPALSILFLFFAATAGAEPCLNLAAPRGIDPSEWTQLRRKLELVKEMKTGGQTSSIEYRMAVIGLRTDAKNLMVDLDLDAYALSLKPLLPNAEKAIEAGISRTLYREIQEKLEFFKTRAVPGSNQHSLMRMGFRTFEETHLIRIDLDTGHITPLPLNFDNSLVGFPREKISWLRSSTKYFRERGISSSDAALREMNLKTLEKDYRVRIDRETGEVYYEPDRINE